MGNSKSSVSQPTTGRIDQYDLGARRNNRSSLYQEPTQKAAASVRSVKDEVSRVNLPWEGDLKGFRFLRSHLVCRYSDIGLSEDDDCTSQTIVASNRAIIASTKTGVTIYDPIHRSIRELSYSAILDPKKVLHSLSPDGKIMIRWTWRNPRTYE
ncbi:hypothetical protein FRC02_002064 [Tulasnella sp. 418]|nr:hypothetical protein FRC02_002064 [Tulasnella sp. 418]